MEAVALWFRLAGGGAEAAQARNETQEPCGNPQEPVGPGRNRCLAAGSTTLPPAASQDGSVRGGEGLRER